MVPSEVTDPTISSAGPEKRAQWVARLQAICASLAFLLAFYGLWRHRALLLAFIRDNDGHCLAAIFSDLVSHEYRMSGWWLTPAPYFFPDMPVLFAISAMVRNLATAYCIYTGFLLAGLFGAFYFITGLMVKSRTQRALTIGWIALLFLLFCRTPHSSYWITAGWFLGPGGHGGGAVVGVLLIGLGMLYLQKPSALGCASFAVIAFFTMISDGLVLPHYLIPLLMGAFVHAARRRTRWYRPVVLTVIVAAAQLACKPTLLWASRKIGVFVPAYEPVLASREMILASWKRFVADLPLVAGITSPMTVMLLSSAVAAIVVMLMDRRRRGKTSTDDSQWSGSNFSLLVMIAAVSCVASVAMPILMGLWFNYDCVRYVYPVMLFPLLVLPAAALAVLRKMPAIPQSIATIAFTGLLVVCWRPVLATPAVNNKKFFYTPQVQFVDSIARKYGLHYGYAEYWWTKPITLFSRRGVVVNEIIFVGDEINPRWWINNPNRWSHAPASQGGGFPIYDFTVLPAGRESYFRAKFGAPAAIEEKGGLVVYIYNRPGDILFRNFLRSMVMERKTPRRKIISHRWLNGIKVPFYPWDGQGVQIIPRDQDLVLRFDRDGTSDFMEIGACGDGTYDLEFRHQNATVGTLRILPDPRGGIHSHQIDLVPIVGGKPFDSIVIHPVGGAAHSIGHLIVFDDPMLHPELVREPASSSRAKAH